MARMIDADAFEKFLMNLPDEVLCEDCCYVVVNEMRNQPTIEPKQEWISVKDRLPERNKLVLVRAVSTARGGNITFVGAYDGFWFLQTAADTIGLTIQYDITHWMPLPEPPERDDE